mmetsp:Transcript_29450/g.54509  ORF Transcript_29450/g.54509 Transcript_29450/m.54509 type:complete len:215 (-) Transcript_29450:146-790(-)
MYEIIYHKHLTFRSAPIEMMLLDAGISFTRVEPQWAPNRVLGESPAGPCFAPPVLRETATDFCVSQFPAIMNYLGNVHGYGQSASGPKEEAVSLQVLLDVCDIGSELFKVGKDDEGKEIFVATGERLSTWFIHLDRMIAKRGGQFLLGDNITAADFALISLFDCLDFCLGADKVSAIVPDGLKACRSALETRPFYAAYHSQAEAPGLFESFKAK